MNKITKLGVSALCGSLAAVSAANAGDLSVTGGVDMTWVSLDNETDKDTLDRYVKRLNDGGELSQEHNDIEIMRTAADNMYSRNLYMFSRSSSDGDVYGPIESVN